MMFQSFSGIKILEIFKAIFKLFTIFTKSSELYLLHEQIYNKKVFISSQIKNKTLKIKPQRFLITAINQLLKHEHTIHIQL
jgi:hypothetical protein